MRLTYKSLSEILAGSPKPAQDQPLTIPTVILYESVKFLVTGSDTNAAAPTFEIVRKDMDPAREAFLHGESADYFSSVIRSWQINAPDQDQVEAMLDQLDWCNNFLLTVN